MSPTRFTGTVTFSVQRGSKKLSLMVASAFVIKHTVGHPPYNRSHQRLGNLAHRVIPIGLFNLATIFPSRLPSASTR